MDHYNLELYLNHIFQNRSIDYYKKNIKAFHFRGVNVIPTFIGNEVHSISVYPITKARTLDRLESIRYALEQSSDRDSSIKSLLVTLLEQIPDEEIKSKSSELINALFEPKDGIDG